MELCSLAWLNLDIKSSTINSQPRGLDTVVAVAEHSAAQSHRSWVPVYVKIFCYGLFWTVKVDSKLQ